MVQVGPVTNQSQQLSFQGVHVKNKKGKISGGVVGFSLTAPLVNTYVTVPTLAKINPEINKLYMAIKEAARNNSQQVLKSSNVKEIIKALNSSDKTVTELTHALSPKVKLVYAFVPLLVTIGATLAGIKAGDKIQDKFSKN